MPLFMFTEPCHEPSRILIRAHDAEHARRLLHRSAGVVDAANWSVEELGGDTGVLWPPMYVNIASRSKVNPEEKLP